MLSKGSGRHVYGITNNIIKLKITENKGTEKAKKL